MSFEKCIKENILEDVSCSSPKLIFVGFFKGRKWKKLVKNNLLCHKNWEILDKNQ